VLDGRVGLGVLAGGGGVLLGLLGVSRDAGGGVEAVVARLVGGGGGVAHRFEVPLSLLGGGPLSRRC
jgi:hypothetical protein